MAVAEQEVHGNGSKLDNGCHILRIADAGWWDVRSWRFQALFARRVESFTKCTMRSEDRHAKGAVTHSRQPWRL